MVVIEKPIYKLIDSKGKVYVPKILRDALDMDRGDIVRLEVEKGKLTVRKVNIVEVGDQSPQAVEAFIRSALPTLPSETQLSIAAKLIELAEQKNKQQL